MHGVFFLAMQILCCLSQLHPVPLGLKTGNGELHIADDFLLRQLTYEWLGRGGFARGISRLNG